MNFSDTIIAISTPPGIGGIAVLRLSGADSWPSALAITKDEGGRMKDETKSPPFNSPPVNWEGEPTASHSPDSETHPSSFILHPSPNSTHFARIAQDGELVDEVVLAFFKGPKSFTGEDVVEISCHGGRYAANRIQEILLDKGLRQARPGEFTERAFLNGKMDLAQAEAVADLIHAKTARSGTAAARQLAGGLSEKIRFYRSKLLDLLALLELELDFSEEDVEFQAKAERIATLKELETQLEKLISTFKQGRLLREGIRVALVGAPNAGKSTLLNALVGHQRAIVSEEPGTTRDVVESRIELEGIEVILQDTAGIRETTGAIESEGIARTKQTIAAADVVFLLVDESDPIFPDKETLALLENKPLFLLKNKIDLRPPVSPPDKSVGRADYSPHQFTGGELKGGLEFQISALKGIGIEELKKNLIVQLMGEEIGQEEIIVAEARHHDALVQAKESIKRAETQINQSTLMASDLRDAVNFLGEITGETVGEEILDRIFSKFCIGK